MATRKIILDGDSTGLRAAASAATTALKAELEAQKKAMADAKAAVKALSKDATAAEKKAAQETTAAIKTVVDAKQAAYNASKAAAKAAAAAVKVANQEEFDSQRKVIESLRHTAELRSKSPKGRKAASDAAFMASGGGGASPGGAAAGGGGIRGDVADLKIMAFVRGLSRGVQMLTAFNDALERRQNELMNKTLSANELAGKRSEALRLAGVSMGEADALGKTIGATAENLSSSDISAALEQVATEGSGKLKGQQVLDVLKVSGSGAAGSALTAASYGLSTKDSVALAERYRLQTRGGSLSREQGQAISGLMSGGALKGAEGVADYLAAAQESGVNVGSIARMDARGAENTAKEKQDVLDMARARVANAASSDEKARAEAEVASAEEGYTVARRAQNVGSAAAPFMGQDQRFIETYNRMRGRASTNQAGASILEKRRNNAQGTEEAALASQDQAMAIGQQAKERARAERILITTSEGGWVDRAGQALRDLLSAQDMFTQQSEERRAFFDTTKKFKIDATVKLPAQR